ncbi:MAG: ABC transporter permease [Christensenellales bacterium]
MKLSKYNKFLNIILSIFTIIGLILIWFLGSVVVDESLILPNPFETLIQIFNLFGMGEFWLGLLSSLTRSLIAFLLSFTIGLGLAILVKFCKVSSPIINIIVAIIRAMPTIAVILLLLLWTNSKVASVVVTMLVVLPTMFSMMQVALNKIDNEILQMCKIYNIPKKTVFFKYIFPIILPTIFSSIGSSLALNIKLIVASEVLAGTANSIGNMMSQSKIYFETPRLFALVIIMIIIAVVIELIFNLISKKVGKNNGID